MKRSQSNYKKAKRTGDVRKDSTPAQLAGIGAVALIYNEVDHLIEVLVHITTRIPFDLAREVSSRINGVEGKIEIVKRGFASLKATQETRNLLANSLGEAGFVRLKKLRDAVIHATILDAPAGIGRTLERRGRASEVLLTEAALSSLYEHLAALRLELVEAAKIAGALWTLERLEQVDAATGVAGADPRERERRLQIQVYFAQYQSHQRRRLSLQPLPEFPQEDLAAPTEGPPQPAGEPSGS